MRWSVPATFVACLALAGTADAATTYCVGFERAGCTGRATAALAFADALDGDRIELGPVTATTALTSARAVTVVGVGATAPVLQGGLTLSNAKAELSDATVHGLRLSGTAARVQVEGVAELRGTAVLQAATVRGTSGIDAVDGTPRLDGVVLDLSGGPGLNVRCDATLSARHVTLVGTPQAAVTTLCATAVAQVRDSILWGPPAAGFAGPGRVVTEYTDHRPVAGHAAGAGDQSVEPGFAPGSARLAPGSPLVDAGSPEALAAEAWPEDRDGLPRIADGNGDGALARDMGAYELPAAAVPLPAANLLRDPGAEAGDGWTLQGGFTRERYGIFPFPSAVAGTTLGGGSAFFAGGAEGLAAAEQLVPVGRLAPEIDLGGARANLAALLGGYRADADAGVLEARFLGPADVLLGTATLNAPTAAERANVTGLLARAQSGDVPPLTRAIAVTLRATRGTPEPRYNDAYFDNVALTVDAPGAPPPPSGRVRRFSGARVLTATAPLDRKGRIAVRVACPDRTVGACTGALTLARTRPGAVPERLAVARLHVRPGRARAVRLRVPRAVRGEVRKRRRLKLRLYLAVRDGQAVVRTATVPVTVKRRPR